MKKTLHQPLSIVAIFLLLSQTFFGSMPVFAKTISNTQPVLAITMIENGQPYVEGNVATSPVTIQVQATSPDSAGVQIELSQDLGATWQPFDTITPLILEDVGNHDVWFKVSDSLGQIVIEKRLIQIAALLSTQVTSVTTPASATIYVNEALPAGGDGKSWTTAYPDLQTALDEAIVGNQIWIAKGTYKPTKPSNPTNPRTVSFQMKNDVAIYGGFEGLREETLAERDFKANETILSGDIGTVGNNADNAYHVFYHPQGLNLNATAILDGVTITGGNATIGSDGNGGGGMFNVGSSPTITNVAFFKNESITTGGGIYNNQSSNPILTNVIFSENTANGNGGGGMYNGIYSNPILTNVVFNENSAIGQSGAGNGGAMNNYVGSNPKLTNVTFNKNKAVTGAGMWNYDNSNPILTNVTISGNITNGSNKGAIYNADSTSRPKIRNSVIVGNNGPAISGSPATIEHSLLGNHEKGKLYDGAGIPSVNEYKIEDIFIHPDLANPTSANYRLKASSPAIDKGVSTYPELAQIMKDLDGNDRIRGWSIDLGAYEFLGFKVSYDGNGSTGGQVPTDSQSYELGNNVIVADNTGNLEKTGFTFTGWNTQADGSGTSYVANATFLMGTSNVTLYAQWTSNPTYTVSYDKNGATSGQEPVDINTYETGKSVAVASNTGNLAKTGFTFTGWNTQADGSGTSYVENATFLMGTSNVTLYAQWTLNPTYTVSYDKNGATSGQEPVDINTYETGKSVAVAANTGNLEKTGFTFTGWNTQADGSGTSYVANATFLMGTSNVTLYAQWTSNPTYTVSYDGNGATGGQVPVDSTKYEVGNNVTVLGNTGSLVKKGNTFAGWNTEADGSGTSYGANVTFPMATTDVTLYAKWDVVRYTLSFDSSGGSTVPTQQISYNQQATTPAFPTKSGYTFAGWYKDKALTKAWDFKKDTVTASTTLYAKWVENSYSGGYSPDPVRYTLTFESNGGSKVATRSIPHNDKSSEPPAPTKEGYTFAGWYKDAALTKAWDFAKDVLTEHTILYAKWTLNSTSGDGDNTPTPIEPVPTPEEPEQPEETTPSYRFNDISNNWAKDMIEDIAARGIITGYPDGSFRPNAPIKREHVAVMLARAFELTQKREATQFSDVPTSHPYYEAITKLQQAGIIDGSNGAFNPSESLTRAQLAKILVLAFGLTPGGTSTFQDVPTTHWSHDYIAALADVGIALGDNGNFRPNEPVTRAQFVAFMYRALNL